MSGTARTRGRKRGDYAKPLQTDIMEAMICAHVYERKTFAEVARTFRTFANVVCERTVRNTYKRWLATGTVDHAPRRLRARKMSAWLLAYMLRLVSDRPWLYLDEIAREVNRESRTRPDIDGKSYSPQYCHAQLHACGWTMKRMRAKAAERDEALRSMYWRAIGDECTCASQCVFGDETALDGRTMRRKLGWGARGHPVDVSHIFHRGKMISVLALYTSEGFSHFEWVYGAFDTEAFMAAMERMLPRVLRPWPSPNSILVLDNCRTHHAEEDALLAIVHGLGVKLLYLAPYCPIDSPIEFGFNSFKAFCRRHGETMDTLEPTDAIAWALSSCYAEAEMGARGTYERCGYAFSDQ